MLEHVNSCSYVNLKQVISFIYRSKKPDTKEIVKELRI